MLTTSKKLGHFCRLKILFHIQNDLACSTLGRLLSLKMIAHLSLPIVGYSKAKIKEGVYT